MTIDQFNELSKEKIIYDICEQFPECKNLYACVDNLSVFKDVDIDRFVFKVYISYSLNNSNDIAYDIFTQRINGKGEWNILSINNATAIEAFWLLANCLGMDNLLKHAENYTVKPIEDGAGDTAVFDKEGELIDDRGELFWALAHLVCHIVPNAEIRGIYQTRYDESGEEYYY